jgi:integral membrane sensor domain MASE1
MITAYLVIILIVNLFGMYTYYKEGMDTKYPKLFETIKIIVVFLIISAFWPPILLGLIIKHLIEGEKENG